MTIQLILNASIAEAFPALAAANAALSANATASLAFNASLNADYSAEIPNVEANLDATLDLGASIALQAADPSLGLTAAVSAIASGDTLASLAIAGPTLTTSLSAAATANATLQTSLASTIAALEAKVAALAAANLALTAQLDASVALNVTLGLGGVRVYLYEGTLANLSSEFSAYMNSGAIARGGMELSTNIHAPIIVTDSTLAFDGLKEIVKLIP